MRKGIDRTERAWAAGLAAVLALTAGCSEDASTGPVAEALTAGEVERLALEDEALLASFMDESFTAEAAVVGGGEVRLSVVPIVTEGEFSWTRNCPGGGQVKVEGSFERQVDREAGTAAVWVDAEKKKEECVHQRGDVEITVNAEASLEAHREWVKNGESWELAAATKWIEGEFSYVTSDGREGSCEFELHAEWDPVAAQVHVTGSYCGREVDRVIERGVESDA